MSTVRGRPRAAKRIEVGESDPSLTAFGGLVVVREMAHRVGLIAELDAAVPSFKVRRRGVGLGEFVLSMACAQLVGEDHLVGLDHRRRDLPAERLLGAVTPASTTVTGLARRLADADWVAVTAATARTTARVLALAAPSTRRRLLEGPVTIDLDCTDIEVYGRAKQQVTYNYLGQRSGRVHAATWAEAGVLAAAELTDSRTTPHTTTAQLLGRALPWLRAAGVDTSELRPRVRADIGYCSRHFAADVVAAGCDFAVGQQRQPKIWRLLHGIAESAWRPARGMEHAEVVAVDYPYKGWPQGTRLLIRRVRHQVSTISRDPRARRRRTLPAEQLALALDGQLDSIYGYSFILTNLPTASAGQAAEVEAWHRHRTDIEEIFKQAKHGAALRHLPSGDRQINTAWVHAAFLAVALTSWMHLLLDSRQRHGIRRWRREVLATPVRLVRHARTLTLRCAPGSLLPTVLARIRALPA